MIWHIFSKIGKKFNIKLRTKLLRLWILVTFTTAASTSSEAIVEVTPGNSLVLRCEVSTPALASHLLVDSWTTKDGRQISVAASHQNHFRGKKSF